MASGTAVGGGVLDANTLKCTSALTVSGGGGAILVVVSAGSPGNVDPDTVTDGTNSYTKLDSLTEGTFGEGTSIWGAKNVANASYTPQANYGGGGVGDGVIVAVPLSGRDTTAPFGTPVHQGNAPGTGADAIDLPSTLTTAAGDDVIYLMLDMSALRNGVNFSPSTGWAERGEFGDSGTTLDGAIHAKDNVSAGTVAPTATQANADTVVRYGLTVKAASGGGPTVAQRRSAMGYRMGSRQGIS